MKVQTKRNFSSRSLHAILPYISIARPDYWVKHVFILPGIIVALILTKNSFFSLFFSFPLGVAAACALSSANYVINEWFDAEFDRFHPLKKFRPAVIGQLRPWIVCIEYAALVLLGLFLAISVSTLFFLIAVLFLLSGVFYNLKPFRTKDRVYFDVISESINNPIRLALGWAIVSSETIPPLSLVLAYWFGGAFLMAAKRLAEYQFIIESQGNPEHGIKTAALYRESFQYYSVPTLLVSCLSYAILSTFGLAVFLMKYRAEYVLSFPFFTLLFAYYLSLSLKPASIAQHPEKLFRNKGLVFILVILVMSLIFLSFVDLPTVTKLLNLPFSRIHLGTN